MVAIFTISSSNCGALVRKYLRSGTAQTQSFGLLEKKCELSFVGLLEQKCELSFVGDCELFQK
jgi:hypothetical protein